MHCGKSRESKKRGIRGIFFPEAAEQKILFGVKRSDMICSYATDLFKSIGQLILQFRFAVLFNFQSAAPGGPLLGEGAQDQETSNHPSCRIYILFDLIACRQEMKGCPVMPEIVCGLRIIIQNSADHPFYLPGFVTQPFFSPFERFSRNI